VTKIEYNRIIMINELSRNYELVIEPRKGLLKIGFKELWEYRDLLYFLIWRDIKIKYKQSILGVGWAVFQPVMYMVVISLVFGKLAKMPSSGVPYPVFSLCGIVIWNYFSQSVTGGTQSLIRNTNLITKVYFPRLIIPLSAVGRGLVDFAIAMVILAEIMLWYGIMPGLSIMAAPFFILLAFMAAAGISMWTSAISAKYRDLPYVIPFVVQIVFWVTPVAYGTEAIPKRYEFLYSLNPMYSVIEGFRWSLVGTEFPPTGILIISVCAVAFMFFSGLIYFRNMERQFADVI
jgi:homopolymeric O-antigen transport system permease protein